MVKVAPYRSGLGVQRDPVVAAVKRPVGKEK